MKKLVHNLNTRIVVALLLVLIVGNGGSIAYGSPSSPDELGPYGVGRTTIVVRDQARNRDLNTNIWYPTQATTGAFAGYRFQVPLIGVDVTVQSEIARQGAPVATGSFPLIMFSHGGNAISVQSFFLTEALASHGFIVVAPDHTRGTLLDIGQPTGYTDPFEAISDRPRDISFLITRMLAKNLNATDPFFGRINPLRIGVTGHSAGGRTALMMSSGFSGQALVELGLVPPPGFTPVPPDSRVKAIIPISMGFDPFLTFLTAGEMSSIDESTMLITGTDDEAVPLATVRAAFNAISANRVMESDVVGGFHFSFSNICDFNEAIAAADQLPLSTVFGPSTDLPCQPGALPIEEVHRITNLYATAFSRYTLQARVSDICFLTKEYAADNEPDVLFQRKPYLVDDALAFSLCRP